MGNPLTKALLVALAATLICATAAVGDSIFDSKDMGRCVIPAVGSTRALGGAVAADLDPLSASILNPCAAAKANYVTLTAGFAHAGTRTDDLGKDKTTITTVFPAVALAVPFGKISLFTGLFAEREGRVTLADTGSYPGSIYDATYKRETSIHSVPVMVSGLAGRRLVLSAGMLFSFLDMREESIVDFRSDEFTDTDDIMDTYASGEGFAAAFVVDLDRVKLGGLFRTGPHLSGSLDRSNRPIGVWSSQAVDISTKDAFRFGLRAEPVAAVAIEADYDQDPWAGLKLDGKALNKTTADRWSLGIQYRGDYLWQASKYPINIGYHREPLDWQGGPTDKIATGKITEEFYSLGTSIPVAQDRASLALALEFGTRRAAARSDLNERIYGVSVSISSLEAWRREIKR